MQRVGWRVRMACIASHGLVPSCGEKGAGNCRPQASMGDPLWQGGPPQEREGQESRAVWLGCRKARCALALARQRGAFAQTGRTGARAACSMPWRMGPWRPCVEPDRCGPRPWLAHAMSHEEDNSIGKHMRGAYRAVCTCGSKLTECVAIQACTCAC